MEYLLWTFDDNEFRFLTGEYQNGMEYIICLKASVILELIRYMCYSDLLKVS